MPRRPPRTPPTEPPRPGRVGAGRWWGAVLLWVGFAAAPPPISAQAIVSASGGGVGEWVYDSLAFRRLADSAQRAVVVTGILVEGNRKTRRDVLLREMSVGVGDTVALATLTEVLDRQRRLLLNTNLFSEVAVVLGRVDYATASVTLRAVVRERWYVYPGVTFDLADRNFNVWWTEQNRSLDRVNYGVKLRHANVSGRADRLTLFVQAGYTRKLELRYDNPYVNRAKTLGFEVGVLVDRNREWRAFTEGGRPEFFDLDTASLLRRRRFRGALTYRPGLFANHALRLERAENRVDTVISEGVNPNFFGDGRPSQQFWGLKYSFTHDRRDVRPFPLTGHFLKLEAEKLGLGNEDVDRFNLSARYARFLPLGRRGAGSRFNLALDAKAKTDLARTLPPYFNLRGLGYDEAFLRGYQYYVVDGLDYAFVKSTLRARLFSTTLHVPKAPVRRLRNIPVAAYLGVHGDVGGAHDPFDTDGNVLANRVLTSYGVGLYGVFYYGKTLRLELSRNDLGEWGGFLGYALGF